MNHTGKLFPNAIHARAQLDSTDGTVVKMRVQPDSLDGLPASQHDSSRQGELWQSLRSLRLVPRSGRVVPGQCIVPTVVTLEFSVLSIIPIHFPFGFPRLQARYQLVETINAVSIFDRRHP